MSKPRPHVTARHLAVHRLDSALPFPGLDGALEAALAERVELGLFVDPAPGLIRIGGLRLRGDILIRPERPGEERRLLIACRHGDRATLAALVEAMGGAWTRSDRGPAPEEGLALLDFLQSDSVVACAQRVEFAERALEDAFGCRFAALDDLRRKVAELNGRALSEEGLLQLIKCDDSGFGDWFDCPAPSLVLHRGEKVLLYLREKLRERRGPTLTLHLALRPGRRACVVGALTERQRSAGA